MKEWYQISTEDVKKKMETSEHGLTTEEAAKRLAQYGENVLVEERKRVFLRFFRTVCGSSRGNSDCGSRDFRLFRGIRRAPLSFWL